MRQLEVLDGLAMPVSGMHLGHQRGSRRLWHLRINPGVSANGDMSVTCLVGKVYRIAPT